MSTPTKSPTLDQKRAAHALKMIQELASNDSDGMYVSYVSALPATIVMNGIGQALATELAKDKGKGRSHRKLFNHLASWLTQPDRPLAGAKPDDPKKIFEALCLSEDNYVASQIEAMAYIHWLKQFARAFLNDKSFTSEATDDQD